MKKSARAGRHGVKARRSPAPRTIVPPKLTAPTPARLYPRERLFELLDRSREDHRVIWVSAPGGAGKTSLATSYLSARKLRSLWYQVDAGDGDVASFFYYMGLAARRATPRSRKPLPVLSQEYLADIPTFTRNFFRDLYRRLPRNSVFVLDNYQETPEDSLLHDVLHTAMTEVPEGMNLIVLSRVEPPAVLARLRLCDHAACLDWSKMQLTPEETAGISAVRMGDKSLNAESLEALHVRARGWAAGVVLMLEQGCDSAWIDPAVTPDGRKLLFDYFAGEFIARAEPAVQEFLLKTALFPKVNADTAESLTGLRNSRDILEDLTRRNYFTVRHASEDGDSYEYHPLFREFLLAHLERQDADALRLLRKKAGQLLEQQGDVESAVELYAVAQEWGAAIRLIVANAGASIAHGRTRLLLQWIERIPEPIRNETPWLLFWAGMGRMSFDAVRAREELEQAFDGFQGAQDVAGIFLAWSGIVQNIMHALTKVDRLDPWIERLDDLLSQGMTYPNVEIEDRVVASMFMALALRQPQHPQFSTWRDRAVLILERSSDPTLRMFTVFYLFTHYIWIGDLPRTEYLMMRLKALGAIEEAAPMAQITVKMAQAWCWMMGRTDESLVRVEEGLALSRQTGVHLWDYLLVIQGTVSALSSGDCDAAETLLGRIEPFVDRARGMDRFYYYHDRAWLALERGELSRAIELQQQAIVLATETAVLFGEANAHFGMSQIRHVARDAEAARSHLATTRELGVRLGSPLIEFMCRVAEAQVAFDAGDDALGLDRLTAALNLGRTRRYVNFTYWRPPVLACLLAKALQYGIETEYVRNIIAIRGLRPPPNEAAPDAWPFPVKLYTLGRFSLLVDDRPVKFSTKTQKKPLDLLKVLVALGGREVSEAKLAEALWPQAEGDAAAQSLATTLHRLRKLIGEDAIERREGRLTLNPEQVWIDAWTLERQMASLEAACRERRTEEVSRLSDRLLALYRGEFLAGESDAHWAIAYRERLRGKCLRLIEHTVGCLQQGRQHAMALACYQKAIEMDPLAEGFYQGLMRCYHALGRRAEALATYERCRRLLAARFGVTPSPQTQALYQQILIP